MSPFPPTSSAEDAEAGRRSAPREEPPVTSREEAGFVTIPRARLEDLQYRVAALSREKVRLLQINKVMGRLNAVSGLENVIGLFLNLLVEISDTGSISLYHVEEDRWHVTEPFGETREIRGIDDPVVASAVRTREFVEFLPETPSGEGPEAIPHPGATWVFPLVAGDTALGAVKMEGMPLKGEEAHELLLPFFCHAALVLKNEVQSLQQLREANQILSTLIEASPLAIVTFDPEGVVTMWNPAAERIFGWTEEEAVGRGLPFVPADKQEEFRKLRRRALHGEVFTEPELHRRKADGSPLVVSVSTSPLRRPDGTIYGIMSILMDVTDRKAAEESRARLSMAVEQAGECIVVTDIRGAIQYVNPAFERITGYARIEAVGQNPKILKSGQHDEAFYRNLWETIGRGEIWKGTFINRRKDGTLYEEDALISPVRDPSGQVVNYVAVKRDVTDMRRMEERLRQSQKMEAVGRLAGGVAHDFNNLLTAISGYCDLLLHRLPEYSTLRRDVDEIRRAGDRAASLTQQLLAFSRRQVLQPKVLDLNVVVTNMTQMLRRLIGEDIELSMSLCRDLGHVKADPGQIEQVIVNLAVNARDALPGGGRITVSTANVDIPPRDAPAHPESRPGPHVLLSMEDTGHGMDEEIRSHLFEPFFTTKEKGKGTGLGLATVYGIVSQSGGHIRVESAPGRGSVFQVYLPRVESPGEGISSAAEPDRSGIPSTGTETVLLVEDEEVVRLLAREILRMNGYTVLEARHGREALLLSDAHQGPIHLMLTDVVMPKMSGRELAERLVPRRPEMRVLYMSGYTDDAIVRHGVLEEGIAFLQKPFTARTLALKVREVLGPA